MLIARGAAWALPVGGSSYRPCKECVKSVYATDVRGILPEQEHIRQPRRYESGRSGYKKSGHVITRAESGVTKFSCQTSQKWKRECPVRMFPAQRAALLAMPMPSANWSSAL